MLIKLIKDELPIVEGIRKYTNISLNKSNQFKCVWHDDNTASATVYPAKDNGHCFGCDKHFDIIDIVANDRGIDNKATLDFLAKELNIETNKQKRKEIRRDAKEYFKYVNADGEVKHATERQNIYYDDGTQGKAIKQCKPNNNGGWDYALGDTERLPYCLPALLKGIDEGKTIYIVEGEKCVHILQGIGLVATTNSGGGGHWGESHSKHIPIKTEVVILPDNDDKGRQHGESVASQLHSRGGKVKVIDLVKYESNLPTKGDIEEWIKLGHTVDELIDIVSKADYWKPDQKTIAVNGIFSTRHNESDQPKEWAEPLPIRKTALLPVEKLPDEIIPAQLRAWLKDISYRMQCPIDFVAIGAMVNLSSLVGTSCGVRPKKHDDWTVIPNLWGGVVGRPSTKKTPSLNEVSKPLVKLGEVAKEEFKNNEKISMADKEVNKARKSALISEMTEVAKGKKSAKRDMDTIKFELAGMEDQEEPVLKRYKTNDSTVEKLGELLQENPRGILVFRDEIMGLLSTLDREDRQGDRAFYLEAWNGNGSCETDRIGRGFIDIPSCCISVLGGIQPSKLLAYLIQSTSTLKNDGMIQRFQLLVFPDEVVDWQFTDKYANGDAKRKAYEIFEKIDGIDYSLIGANCEDDKYFFRFSNEGYEVFKEWQISERAKGTNENENPLIIEHLDKYASLMPSLALIFHLISVVTGEVVGEDTKTISERCAIMACGWCEYLESHARRIYGMLSGVGDQRVIELSKHIIKGDLVDGFTVRDIYRKEWHLLDSKESAEDACNELEKLGWIKQELKPFLNRPARTTYIINPKINKS